MSIKKLCILEYVKRKTKATLQIFFIWYVKLEYYVVYYQKKKNDLNLTLRDTLTLTLRDTLGRTRKVITNQNLFSRFQS